MQIDHKCVLDRCPAEKSSYCSGAITQRILSRRSPLFRCIDTDPWCAWRLTACICIHICMSEKGVGFLFSKKILISVIMSVCICIRPKGVAWNEMQNVTRSSIFRAFHWCISFWGQKRKWNAHFIVRNEMQKWNATPGQPIKTPKMIVFLAANYICMILIVTTPSAPLHKMS